jgi:hypothetical protein
VAPAPAPQDWPRCIEQPELPPGYQWVCLRRCAAHDGRLEWWCMVRFTMSNGKLRALAIFPVFFSSPERAVASAVRHVVEHAGRRA